MADNDESTMQVNDGANGERVLRVNYPGNSNKAKKDAPKAPDQPSEKKVERITTGEVIQRKKGLGRKIAETFTADKMANVGQYILQEIVVPQVKTIISDAISQGTDRTLFGDSRRNQSRPATNYGSGSRTNYTSYNRFATNPPAGRAGEPDGPRNMTNRGRASHDFSEIILNNRGEADQVLDEMNRLLGQYEFVTVSDLYDLVGITGAFTDEKWGWSDLRDARIRRVSGGFLLDLPTTVPID